MVDSKENVNTDNLTSAGTSSSTKSTPAQSAGQKYLANSVKEKDPIFDTSSESEGGANDNAESSGSEESSDGDIDFEFPRDNAADLMQFLHREFTNLSNLEDNTKRKFALIKFYQVFVLAKEKPEKRVYVEVLPQIQKLLYKRFSDPVEKNRELACLIVKEFFSVVDDLTLSIPYLMPVLIQRLNAEDLEGIESLPEEMQPSANQKPLVMVDPPETSEAVRLLIAQIVTIMVSSTVFDCMRPYTQELVSILRALCMDPAGQVIIEGCQGMKEFATAGNDQLIHFCEVMGRSLFTSFVHKHAKVRMAGLNALFDVMVCGKWKHSHMIMSHMVGFRDPNIVPIKDFYEPSTKLNYFAGFVADRSTLVRDCFYRTVGDMLARLPDKFDHEGQLFPYLISGLYDDNDKIGQAVFDIIEELGQLHEEENEEKFRERKQLGFNEEWTLNGEIKDSQIDLPFPVMHRPRLGARVLVRSYVRRYIKAIFHELGDWIEENAERTSNLLLYSILYSEDFMTQFMDEMLVAMYRTTLSKTNKVLMKNMPRCFRFLGRYCMPNTYEKLILPAIGNELASCFAFTQAGALKGFGFMFRGAIELLPESKHLSKVEQLLKNFMKTVKDHVIDALDLELAEILVGTLTEIVESLLDKQAAGVDPKWLIQPYLVDFMKMALKALAVFQSFDLQGKGDPDNVKQCKKQIKEFFGKLTELSDDPSQSFFDKNISQVIADNFVYKRSEQLSCMSLQAPTWRLYHALFDLLTSEHMQMELPEPESVFTQQARIRSQQQTELKQVTFEDIKEGEKADENEEDKDDADRPENAAAEQQPETSQATTEEVPMASQEPIDTSEKKEEEKKERVPEWNKKVKPMQKIWPKIDEEETEDESVRQPTVFQELCRVLLGVLKNGESKNNKVKHIALYKLFPKFVNICLPFITHEHSLWFQRILVRGAKIEWGDDAAKVKYFTPQLDLASQLVSSGGLILDVNLEKKSVANFKRILQTFSRCYLETTEQMKRNVLRRMYQYIVQLNLQTIMKVENGQELLFDTDLLHSITENLIPMIKDYYDSVRDQACVLLEYMITHLLRRSPIQGSSSNTDLLQVLKKSAEMGFSDSMATPCRTAADAEAEYIHYMFADPQDFLKQLLTAMMDEAATRESITRIILKLNKQYPFLLLNDLRISTANNSLQRQEVIKALLQRAASQV